jgi:DNA-binding response OmpR family regulator
MSELKTRILVVDDDQRLRELLVRYLGGEGYEVKAVPDAAAMDKQLARERYDLVVLDLMLPGEDGLAICRRLRTQLTAPAISSANGATRATTIKNDQRIRRERRSATLRLWASSLSAR